VAGWRPLTNEEDKSVAELSNISGNPHEPVVVIGDDLDQPGNKLVSRLPAPDSVPGADVIAYDEAAAREAAAPEAPANTGPSSSSDAADGETAAQAGEAPAGDTGQ
jgi:hypothetical protein